ncbi:MAG: hypothetical protein GY699_19675 [Desulfobacteraceae bacterium]|nr:hypothetical protein [Desulfobacteraceae bacterium]
MPTIEERSKENQAELNQRIEAKTLEMGITYSFAQYLEHLETYLLQLEKRVKDLEAKNDNKPVG